VSTVFADTSTTTGYRDISALASANTRSGTRIGTSVSAVLANTSATTGYRDISALADTDAGTSTRARTVIVVVVPTVISGLSRRRSSVLGRTDITGSDCGGCQHGTEHNDNACCQTDTEKAHGPPIPSLNPQRAEAHTKTLLAGLQQMYVPIGYVPRDSMSRHLRELIHPNLRGPEAQHSMGAN
jgi:hypothetical protein